MRLPPELHGIILNYLMDMKSYDLYVRFNAFLNYNRCVRAIRIISLSVVDITGRFDVSFVMNRPLFKKNWVVD